jgi:hypothetical protein
MAEGCRPGPACSSTRAGHQRASTAHRRARADAGAGAPGETDHRAARAGRRRRALEGTSGTALWSRIGQPVLPLRGVSVRAPTGQLDPRASVSTHPRARPRARAGVHHTMAQRHDLGGEPGPSRPWAARALERTTLCLCGLYAGVALLAKALHPSGQVPSQRPAWDDKAHTPFAEVWAAVRRQRGGDLRDSTSARASDLSSTFALLLGIGLNDDLRRRLCHTPYAAGARLYRMVSWSDRESFENSWGSACV